MSSYNTTGDNSSSSSSQFVSRLKETAQSLAAIRRPWRDFVDPTALNLPAPLSESTTRVAQNLTHFRANYIVIILFITCLTLIFHPIAIFAFFVTLLAWSFFYFSRDDPLTVFQFTIDEKVVVAGLFALTVGVMIWAGVWTNVLVAAFVGGSLVIVHAMLRSTDDLVMDDLESPYGPMFELDDDSAEGGAYSGI